MVAPHATTDRPTRWTSLGMRRPKDLAPTGGPSPPTTTARASTASVVTLMPPAVEAEPPPTNMSMGADQQRRPVQLPDVHDGEPAGSRHGGQEEGLVDGVPRVAAAEGRGLLYSRARNAVAPAKNRARW